MLRPSDVLRMALSILRERRLRAILTIIGIAIGPAAMVAIIGTVEGYSQAIIGQLSSLGQNAIVLLSTPRYTLKDGDVKYVRMLREVDTAVPFYSLKASLRRRDGRTLTVTLYVTDLNALFRIIPSLELIDGKVPSPSAYSYGLFGHDIAYSDGESVLKVGDVVTVRIASVEGGRIIMRTKSISVAGVLDKYGNALAVNPDMTIFLPLSAGRALLGMNRYTGVLAAAEDASYVKPLVDELKERYGDLAEVIAFQYVARALNSVIKTLNFLLLTLSLSAFVVAITGIMATMFTSIMERTREIGVLKAMGFSNRHILILVLTEALIMSLIGGSLGVLAGTAGAYYLSSLSFRIGGSAELVFTASPAITPGLLAQSLGMAVLVGIAGGLIPAYKASSVPPVEALRYE